MTRRSTAWCTTPMWASCSPPGGAMGPPSTAPPFTSAATTCPMPLWCAAPPSMTGRIRTGTSPSCAGCMTGAWTTGALPRRPWTAARSRQAGRRSSSSATCPPGTMPPGRSSPRRPEPPPPAWMAAPWTRSTPGRCSSPRRVPQRPLRTPAVKMKKWLPSSGSHFPYLPDHTGAQESWSTPLRYSLGDTPITSRKARANLLALS